MSYSWSSELNSNTSVGTPDPSIPVPSNGHSVSKNLRIAGGYTAFLDTRYPSHSSHFSYHSHPSTIPAHSHFGTVNFVNSTAIHLCNPLIARVRTVSHVNKKIFSTLRAPQENTQSETHVSTANQPFSEISLCPLCHFLCVLCVLCVTLFRKTEPSLKP